MSDQGHEIAERRRVFGEWLFLDDSPRRLPFVVSKDDRACDLWASAFFAPLVDTEGAAAQLVPTSDTLRRFLAQPRAAYGPLVGGAVAIAVERRFFHWPLEFPEVVADGGFDVVLGNPPFLGGLKISVELGDAYRRFLELSGAERRQTLENWFNPYQLRPAFLLEKNR